MLNLQVDDFIHCDDLEDPWKSLCGVLSFHLTQEEVEVTCPACKTILGEN